MCCTCAGNGTALRLRLQVNHLETHDSFVGYAHAAGLEVVESLDKTPSMAMHFQTLIEVHMPLF